MKNTIRIRKVYITKFKYKIPTLKSNYLWLYIYSGLLPRKCVDVSILDIMSGDPFKEAHRLKSQERNNKL